jgi:hypothetical protein
MRSRAVAAERFRYQDGMMRKRLTKFHYEPPGGEPDRHWIDIEQIATVEVTSEDPEFPIDRVFGSTSLIGWRASEPGGQQIRLIFDVPLSVHRIKLCFHEAELERTQEFTIRWSSGSGRMREIVRQQWNFSPTGSTTEIEDYFVDLDSVSVLELALRPDLGGRDVVATLASFRLG